MANRFRPIRRDDDPPPSDPYGEIYRIKGVKRQRFLILSDRVAGFVGHWVRGHMESCIDPKEECLLCEQGWETRWTGFLHCQSVIDASETRFVQLTRGAKTSIDLQVSKEQSLRGLLMELWRTSVVEKAHLRVQLYPRTAELSSLQPAGDPTPHVQRLWGAKPKPEGPAFKITG